MNKSLVLIADIEASKEVKQGKREELQQKLKKVLETLSRENKGIVSPYTITLGDEFQAVFKNADHLFKDIFKILATLHPISVRFSLGVGDISTPINKEQAIGMDGPAFHEAREGIKQLKKSGYLFNIRIEEENDMIFKIINNSLQLISTEIRSWNKRRLLIFHLLREGHDYKSITQKLDISRAAFYKNKEMGALDIIDELSDNIAQIINEKLKS
ncbi:MAG TPA: SatD family protein [Balneolaceae bacterium]|nr:SatD family protein [Balneolaceae bacterium]